MTINGLINAEYDFSAIGDWIKSTYDFITANATVSNLWDALMSYVALVPAIAVSGVLLVLSLIQVFFGKKLLGLQKFLGCFVAGFALSVVYLVDFIPETIQISPLIVGLVVGIVAALLCKLVYFLAYIGVAGYAAYAVCMGGYYLPEAVTAITKGNMVVSLVVAGVVIIVVLILKKLIEMVGTATLGAYCAWLSVVAILGHLGLAFEASALATVKLVVMIALALIGSVVQIKTRKRKW